MSTLDRQPEMSSPEGPAGAQYRPLSKAAIAAPFLAAASLLAFLHPWYWVVPAVAIAVSSFALVRTSARGEHSGRPLAILALAFAVLIGACAPSRSLIVDGWFRSEAVEFAESWLDLVRRGRLGQAHQWTKPAGERLPEESALEELYASFTAEHPDLPLATEYAEFRSTPAPRIAKMGADAEIRLEEYLGAGSELGEARQAEMIFSITPPDGEPVRVRIVVERSYNPDRQRGEWRVLRFELE